MSNATLTEEFVSFDVAELTRPSVSIIGVMLDEATNASTAPETLWSWDSVGTSTCTAATCCDQRPGCGKPKD